VAKKQPLTKAALAKAASLLGRKSAAARKKSTKKAGKQ
jgi:hypothetical protein